MEYARLSAWAAAPQLVLVLAHLVAAPQLVLVLAHLAAAPQSVSVLAHRFGANRARLVGVVLAHRFGVNRAQHLLPSGDGRHHDVRRAHARAKEALQTGQPSLVVSRLPHDVWLAGYRLYKSIL